MRVLITGIEGFTGGHLASVLALAGYEVFGLARSAPRRTINHCAAVHVCDLLYRDGLARVVADLRPHYVFHLAGISFVAHGDVEEIYKANVIGARNLLDAMASHGKDVRGVMLASSANVYGPGDGRPMTEETPFAPANDYAVSKIAMEYAASLYRARLPIIIVRPFNYTGVGQSAEFLAPKIVSHLRQRATAIELGNLDVARDISDVRMVVDAYQRLMETPAAFGQTINVCSGVAHSLRDILTTAQTLAGHDMAVTVNPQFVRINEVRQLLGDPARLIGLIGPLKSYSLADTLGWMLNTSQS